MWVTSTCSPETRAQHPDQLLKTLFAAARGQLQDHGELVASEPAHGGARARPRGEPGTESSEDGVTRRVSEAVVDLLEPVGIDHDHSRAVAVAGEEEAGAGGVA